MPLFATTEELREFFPARVTFKFEDIRPTLKSVEQEYLVEQVLGEDQYQELVEAIEDEALTPELQDLLTKCREVVAPLAIAQFTGVANVEFTSGGLVTGQSEHKRPASEWRTRDLERTMLRQGFRALDTLVSFLLRRADSYELWAESEQAQDLSRGWITTAREFQRHVPINNSGYLYLRMRPTQLRLEEGVIRSTLCSDDVVADLRTKITDQNLSTTEQRLVACVHAATAHLTMADCVVELALQMDERGVWTFATVLGQTSGGPMPASDVRLQQRIDHHRAVGEKMLADVKAILQALAEADPAHPYRTSPCYVDPAKAQTDRYQQDSSVGGFLT